MKKLCLLIACVACLGLVGPVAAQCPVMGQGCVCGCQQGTPCTCMSAAAKLEWLREPGSDDQGLWRGDVLVCRYFAAEKCYRAWTGRAYGPPSSVPVTGMAANPMAVSPMTYQPRERINFFQPFGGFGGGCSSGRCH